MPYTDNGIYYPDDATTQSIGTITQAIAESIDDKLGIVSVQYSTTNTIVTNTSSTAYGNSGLSVTIKPKSATNKIIVLTHLPFQASGTTTYWSSADFILKRDDTIIFTASPGVFNLNDQPNGSAMLFSSALSINYVDTPNTTNEITYIVQGKMSNLSPAGSAKTLSMNYSDGAAYSTLVILEVAS